MVMVRSLALLVAFVPMVAFATPIEVGVVTVEIPPPPGFARVIPEMTEVSELQQHFVPPTNVQFAAFIPEADVPEALAGEVPLMRRRFTVQTARDLVSKPVTPSDFMQVKRVFSSNNEQMFDELRSKVPDLMSQASKGVSEQFDTQFVIDVGGLVPLPPHHEDRHSVSMSMFARNEFSDGDGDVWVDVIAATMTLLHVKDRVLFVYAYGAQDDLDWSREASRAFADAIVAANAGDMGSRASSHVPRSSRGIDWDKVVSRGVGGATLALLVALISWLVGRRRQG